WYSDENLTKLYTFTTMPAENITLYAKWTESENIIRYITNGGVNDESNPTTYTTGEEILLKEATRKGYTFKGWYSDEQFNNKVEKITAKMNEDMILYALWEANTCTITFNSNGGSIVPTIEKLYGEKIAEPDIPTKEGYKFAGWYSDENLTKLYTFTTMPAENMTLYAKWYVYYTIDYILDGGINNESNPISYLPGETKELKEPSKEGYVFAGWYLDPNYEQVIDNITSDMEGNITLYAKWQKGDLIVKVPITWAGIPLYMIISGVILLFISLGLYIYLKLDKKIKP
ncbi:MAG: InlB B-repeat-containing protein, partial [Bacilli bacterium]|nr:InlB B-repeat-containing protein [Bacilli bacterium]